MLMGASGGHWREAVEGMPWGLGRTVGEKVRLLSYMDLDIACGS